MKSREKEPNLAIFKRSCEFYKFYFCFYYKCENFIAWKVNGGSFTVGGVAKCGRFFCSTMGGK